jgi:membrane protein DedA with SNARE-associated domain
MLADALALASGEPLLFAGLLFAATFVAEDAATVAAGLGTAALGIDPVLPLAAVVLGTATGDLALYGLGRWGANTRRGRTLCARPEVCAALGRFDGRSHAFILAARFAPGTRLPVFTASGLVKTPFPALLAIVVLSTLLWTTLLFEAARKFGESGVDQLIAVLTPIGLINFAAILFLRRPRTRAISRQPQIQGERP